MEGFQSASFVTPNIISQVFITFDLRVFNIYLFQLLGKRLRIQQMNACVFKVNLRLVSSRLGVRACVVLSPLLDVTWLIGFLVPLHIAFSYIFVILNFTQVTSSKTLKVCSSIWSLMGRDKSVLTTK